MKRAFIINLDITDGMPPEEIAADLQDVIASEGYVVLSVAPWGTHSNGPSPTIGLLPQSGLNTLGVPTLSPNDDEDSGSLGL